MAEKTRGQVALITGASAGIGAALAHELIRRGGRVALVARRAERIQALAEELGQDALAATADVTDRGALDAAVAATLERFGRLDVVVANAGFGVAGKTEKLTVDDFRRQFETNVFGVLHTFYATLDALKQSRGSFVVVGSVNSYLSPPATTPYAMSKYAVRALAEGLYSELRHHGIAVTLVCPGFVDSDIRRTDNLGRLHDDAPEPVPGWLRMPSDVAARKIARAIARRRREIVITGHGKVAVFLARHLPRTTAFLMSRFGPRRPSSRSRATHPEG